MKLETTAENRKDVVKAMEEITGEKAKYQGPPSFAYQVGEFTIDRDGNVEHESEKEIENLKEQLQARGLVPEEREMLSIDIPMEGHTADSIKNLIYMIHSKQYLLNKAVGMAAFKISDKLVERLEAEESIPTERVLEIIREENVVGITFAEDKICFTGFPLEPERTTAFCELAAFMAKAAREQKRVNPQETIEENEKYYMRTWLVRIGLGGKGGKETRKVLLEGLKGHTAFRTEDDKVKWKEQQKARKQKEISGE